MGIKIRVVGGFLALLIIFAAFYLAFGMYNLSVGKQHIKQAFYTGEITVIQKPGYYASNFGDIEEWPIEQTEFFTHDKDSATDTLKDKSVEVRFTDGSITNISSTFRVILPTNKTKIKYLTEVRGFRTYDQIVDGLIKPAFRKYTRNAAELMSATDSYKTRRSEYIAMVEDQLNNGVYDLTTTIKQVKEDELCIDQDKTKTLDEVKCKLVEKTIKVVKYIRDKKGNIIKPSYGENMLAGTGIRITNFEIKKFKYDKKVKDQIAQQQILLMAAATAKAGASKFREETLKEAAKGQKDVTIRKYEAEVAKIQKVTKAEERKEVAELKAQQDLNVATKAAETATQYKLKLILEGQGLAEKKRLIMAADGALKQRLASAERIHAGYAKAYENRAVPTYYVAGGSEGNLDNNANQFRNMMDILVAKSIGVPLDVSQRVK